MQPLTQGQESTLPLIQPSRSASAPPVMYENDKTKEGRGYKQSCPGSTTDDPTRCTNQDAAMDFSVKPYKIPIGWPSCITIVDESIFDERRVEEDTYFRLMNQVRQQHILSANIYEEGAELWNLVQRCERDMLQEEVAFGRAWGHHNKKRVKWMEKTVAKQKELEASYETIAALMERLAKV